MKKIHFTRTFVVALILLHSTLTGCSQGFEKMNPDEISETQISIVESFANSFFTQLKNGDSYVFEDNAIEQIKTTFTEEKQKQTYTSIKNQFGDYESSSYTETWKIKTNDKYFIFRLKGTFSDTPKAIEIRVTLDSNNKIAGLFVKPWSDILN